MAAPTPYALAYDFTAFQAATPTVPLPADKIEIEYNALQTTTGELIANLGLIQKTDGTLANLSVGNAQLKSEVVIGVNTAASWLTSTAYAVNDAVYQGNNVYLCLVAHTSGVFATDLAAVKWEILLNFNQFVTATAADAVSTAADVVSTNADVVLTNADVVSTNADAAVLGSLLSGTQIQLDKGADVASATALPILTDGNFFDVTGTNTVTSFNTTGSVGTSYVTQFDGALILTHHATDLILPSGANITTAAGDVAHWIEYASGDVICTNYSKADGTAVVAVKLTVAQEYTKTQNFNATSLTSTSNSIAWNAEDNQVAKHTFTENTTLANPTNLKDGATYIITFTQHASSPKTLAFGSAYKFPSGTAPTVTATNSAVDILTFVCDGTNLYGVSQLNFS